MFGVTVELNLLSTQVRWTYFFEKKPSLFILLISIDLSHLISVSRSVTYQQVGSEFCYSVNSVLLQCKQGKKPTKNRVTFMYSP